MDKGLEGGSARGTGGRKGKPHRIGCRCTGVGCAPAPLLFGGQLDVIASAAYGKGCRCQRCGEREGGGPATADDSHRAGLGDGLCAKEQ